MHGRWNKHLAEGSQRTPPQQITNGRDTVVPGVFPLSDYPASRPLYVVPATASRPVRNSAVVVLVCGRHVGCVRRRWRRRRPACWTRRLCRRLCRGRWLARRRSRGSNGRGRRAEYSARFSLRAARGARAGAVAGQRARDDVSAVIDGRIWECAGDLAAATAVTTQVLIN